MLNDRKLDIVKFLLNEKRTIDEISDALSVSTRTIRRDLIHVQDVVSELGYEIRKNKKEYIIIDSEMSLLNKITEKFISSFSHEEKIIFCFEPICKKEDYIDLEIIATKLFMPMPTLKRELISYLESKNYNYINKGSKISFDLTDKLFKSMIISVLKDYLSTINIDHVIISGSLEEETIKINKVLLNYINISEFDSLLQNVENVFNKKNIYIPDFELIFVVVTGLFCKKYESADTTEGIKPIIVNSITSEICELLNLKTEVQKNYFMFLLERLITELEYEKVDYESIDEITLAIEEFENKLGFEIHDKKKLEYQITTHNARVKDMDNYDIVDNYSLNELVEKYNMFYNELKSNKHLINYNEIEIKYLLIYFIMAVEETLYKKSWNIAVVCFGGVGTSLMIRTHLEKQYTNSNIKNSSLARLLSNDSTDIDLVVSNSNLPNDIQDVVVPHIVTPQDFKNINMKLLSKFNKIKKEEEKEEIVININIDRSNDDHDTVLKYILEKYENNNTIYDSQYVYEKLKKREKLGVGIPNSKIGFFHTRSSSINKLVVEVIRTKKYNCKYLDDTIGDCNYILMLLVPAKISDNLLEKINLFSYSLISDNDLIEFITSGNREKIEKKFK